MPDLDMTTRAIITAGALLSLFAGWWRWVRPRYHKAKRDGVAIRDVLLGREAQLDSITHVETSPAIPGIGQRMSTVEHAVIIFAENRRDLDSLLESRDEHGTEIADLKDAVAELKEASVERVANRVDSIAGWQAVAAAHGITLDLPTIEPDQESDPTP